MPFDVGFGFGIASVLVAVAAHDGGCSNAYADHSKEDLGRAVVELEEFDYRFVLLVSDGVLVIQVLDSSLDPVADFILDF